MAKRARRFLISGRVQGVGYRAFAERNAEELRITGWVRNLDDGRVEAHANGTERQLDDFEARLRMGPKFGEVRALEAQEAAVTDESGFRVR